MLQSAVDNSGLLCDRIKQQNKQKLFFIVLTAKVRFFFIACVKAGRQAMS